MTLKNGIAIALVALTVPLASCDTDALLEVEDPDVALPAALQDTTNLAAVRGLGVGDFSVAYGGASTTVGLVAITGIFADELFHSGTFLPNRELDKRDVTDTNSSVTTVFRALHRARRSTQIAAETFKTARGNTRELAELQNLNAYSLLLLAENWCSGVPISQDPGGVFEFGPSLTTAELFALASTRFDEALATANAVGAVASVQANLARVGKARVLLNQERFADAAQLVSAVPTGFRYQMEYSANTARQNNGIFGITQQRREYGISHIEGINGLPFRQTPADPRVPWTRDAGAADAAVRQYTPRKYNSEGAPIDLASGIEARLIEAEAALNKGASAAYLPILNTLRATLPGLTPLTDPGSSAGRVDQFFRERAFWLHLQAQRMVDLRRLVRQYGRAENTVFPTGRYVREGVDGSLRPDAAPYGTNVNFPIPVDEVNNPQSKQCIDRRA